MALYQQLILSTLEEGKIMMLILVMLNYIKLLLIAQLVTESMDYDDDMGLIPIIIICYIASQLLKRI